MLTKKNAITRSTEEGFSLIELLVVIIVLGILSTIAFVLYADKKKEATIAGIKSDVRSLNVATLSYIDMHHDANNLGFVKTSGTSSPSGSLAAHDLFKNINPSDSKTSLTLRGATASLPNGSWNSYTLIGSSTEVVLNKTYSYYYFSETGKYTEIVS